MKRNILASVVIIVLLFGYHFPALGYIVPVVMFSGLFTSFFKGRYFCGNYCPRGSFLDKLISKISPSKKIPKKFFDYKVRGVVLVLLMSNMTYQIAQNPTSFNHIGLVFWQLCLVTTGIALFFALFIHERTWCAICPMGTMESLVVKAKIGKNSNIKIKEGCKSCNACSNKSCPFDLPVGSYADSGEVSHPDCLKCGKCIQACPFDKLYT